MDQSGDRGDELAESSSVQRVEGDRASEDRASDSRVCSREEEDLDRSGGNFVRGESSGTNPVGIIGQGRAAVLKSVIRDADSKFEAALASQDALAISIDRLTRVLDKLLEDTPMPFLAQDSARIHGLRKRILSLSSTLQIIRLRMKNIESSLRHNSPPRSTSAKKSPMNSPRISRNSPPNSPRTTTPISRSARNSPAPTKKSGGYHLI